MISRRAVASVATVVTMGAALVGCGDKDPASGSFIPETPEVTASETDKLPDAVLRNVLGVVALRGPEYQGSAFRVSKDTFITVGHVALGSSESPNCTLEVNARNSSGEGRALKVSHVGGEYAEKVDILTRRDMGTVSIGDATEIEDTPVIPIAETPLREGERGFLVSWGLKGPDFQSSNPVYGMDEVTRTPTILGAKYIGTTGKGAMVVEPDGTIYDLNGRPSAPGTPQVEEQASGGAFIGEDGRVYGAISAGGLPTDEQKNNLGLLLPGVTLGELPNGIGIIQPVTPQTVGAILQVAC